MRCMVLIICSGPQHICTGQVYLPANIALCARNSLPPTANVTSLNRSLSNKLPRSSDNLHSGTLNCTILLWPEMLTLSATTLTSQNIVNLSSGNKPFASSNRKSLRMNFLKPQSFPCTKRYALCDKPKMKIEEMRNCLLEICIGIRVYSRI